MSVRGALLGISVWVFEFLGLLGELVWCVGSPGVDGWWFFPVGIVK